MEEIKATGNIRNIQAADGGISFECGPEGTPAFVVDGVKAAVLHSLLMEGDPVTVTGIPAERSGVPCVKVTGLDVF